MQTYLRNVNHQYFVAEGVVGQDEKPSSPTKRIRRKYEVVDGEYGTIIGGSFNFKSSGAKKKQGN